jgi:hypothetical protein
LSVDGRQIQQFEKYRVHSRAFNVTFPENAIFGAEAGPSRAVSDGYWIILKPLPIGEHEILFKESLTNPITGILLFAQETKYHLNVVEAAEVLQLNCQRCLALLSSCCSSLLCMYVQVPSLNIFMENTVVLYLPK